MPKYSFKPSCSLSKGSKVKRLALPEFDKFNFPPLSPKQYERPRQNESEVTTLSFIDSQTTNSQGIIYIVSSENQNVSENENFSNSENISDPLVFQSKLASFIISSKHPRSNATKLLKLLKSVDNLQCLQSLPTDSRTLLSTPRSGLVDYIGGGKYIHFGISHGL